MTARIKAFFAALVGASWLPRPSPPHPPDCAQFSPNGRPPVVANAKMRAATQELCYSDFAVLHSGVTHGPLWSAEHLTAAHVDDAKNNTRTNRFFPERKLPPGAGAQLADCTSEAATTAAT